MLKHNLRRSRTRGSDREASPGVCRAGEYRRSLDMIRLTPQKLLDVLAQLCDRSPGVRFGQLLAHLGFLAEDRGSPGLGEVEDEDLLAAMEQHLDEMSRRQQPIAEPRDAANRAGRSELRGVD